MSDDYDDPSDDDEAPFDGAVELAEPRANSELFGHETAEQMLLQAYLSGRLPHAWLITGPRGVGKATLAFRFARFLLAEGASGGGGGLFFAAPPASLVVDPSHPVFRRIAAGGHGDLLTVERTAGKRDRKRAEIVVEDTRTIGAFLRLTSAEGGWRIVIIDEADLMNSNAANAVLKILEEPPRQALLMLLSDNPGRLLPTIRSRCRKLALKRLPDELVTRCLATVRPDLSPGDTEQLARLAEGSLGRALELANQGGLELQKSLVRILVQLPRLDGAGLHAFADKLVRAEADQSYRLVAELLPAWVARMISTISNPARDQPSGAEGEAMRRLAARRNLDQWVEVWEKLTHLFAQADGINLDRKQVLLNAFFALEEAAR